MRIGRLWGIAIGIFGVLILGIFVFWGGGKMDSGYLTQIKSLVPSVLLSASDPWALYENGEYRFSFSFPSRYAKEELFQDGRFTVLFKENAKSAFQISVESFDEAGPFSDDRIRRDIPEIAIEGFQMAEIGGEPASLFFDATLPEAKLREVWFTHGGYLYQISAPAGIDEVLSRIMATWEFE